MLGGHKSALTYMNYLDNICFNFYLFDVAFKAPKPLNGVQHEVVVPGSLPGRQKDGEFFFATEEKDKAVILVFTGRRVSFGLQKFGKLVHTFLFPFGTNAPDANLQDKNTNMKTKREYVINE